MFARHNGSWKTAVSVHVKSGGSWVKVFDERPLANVTATYTIDYGTGYYFNIKEFTLITNGFTTSLYNDGVFVNTYAADTVNSLSAQGNPNFAGAYPTMTATNASASITF